MTVKISFVFALSFIMIFLFYLVFSFTNITALVIANSIPRYPGATWAIGGSGGITDDIPGARIKAKTDHSEASILEFYRNELGKRGWKLIKDKDHPLDNDIVFQKDFRYNNKITTAKASFTIYESIYDNISDSGNDDKFWIQITYKNN